MRKIVVTNNQDFTDEQVSRLNDLGDVTYYDQLPKSPQEYLDRIKDADIICSGTEGLKDAYPKMKDVFIAVAFVSVAFVDVNVLKKNNVLISNAPGSNKHAVAEWIICMMIYLMRDMARYINSTEEFRVDASLPPLTAGLAGKNITILGRGNIGQQVGKSVKALDMNVSFFARGDDLYKSVANADVIVNALSSNPGTAGLLDEKFFKALKPGAFFLTVTRNEIMDVDAMLNALDDGILAKVATDAGGILVGDVNDAYYQKLLKHPKVIVTPHIAYNTEVSTKMGNDIMLDNVEAFINGQPINLVN